jgi:hypothetical protein
MDYIAIEHFQAYKLKIDSYNKYEIEPVLLHYASLIKGFFGIDVLPPTKPSQYSNSTLCLQIIIPKSLEVGRGPILVSKPQKKPRKRAIDDDNCGRSKLNLQLTSSHSSLHFIQTSLQILPPKSDFERIFKFLKTATPEKAMFYKT